MIGPNLVAPPSQRLASGALVEHPGQGSVVAELHPQEVVLQAAAIDLHPRRRGRPASEYPKRRHAGRRGQYEALLRRLAAGQGIGALQTHRSRVQVGIDDQQPGRTIAPHPRSNLGQNRLSSLAGGRDHLGELALGAGIDIANAAAGQDIVELIDHQGAPLRLQRGRLGGA